MNGIENISEKILADAKEKSNAILAEAEASAEGILQEGTQRAQTEAKILLDASSAKVLDIEEKGRLSASLEHKKALQS